MIEIIEFVFHFLFKVSGLNPRDSCNLTGCGSGLFFTIFFLPKWQNYYLHKEVMFSPLSVSLFVCLSSGYLKKY